MDTDRFQLLSDLFEKASALPAAERSEFLTQHCNGDMALRAELEALLGHAEKPDDPVVTAAGLDALFEEAGLPPSGTRRPGGKMPEIIGRNPNQTPSPLHADRGSQSGQPSTGFGHAPGAAPMPLLTGQYRILRVVGEGGMGIVYEAEQAFPKRRVALKSIRPGLFTRRMLRRFQNEAHILGRLQHPGIAQIYEAGASDPQSPDDAFFVMEFVDGPPLTTYAEQKKLSTRRRAEIMIEVCDAVHHAHQRGVIHRDLKPGNILIAEDPDGTPRPKILDFGVARVTERTRDGGGKDGVGGEAGKCEPETMLTHAGQLIGTLAYMSPEQISAGPADIDVRTDVYALGVVLYQLLTGKLPLDLADKSIPDAAQMVRETEPSRLGTIDRSYRGDLETIVAKAMAKDRTRRYQSAAELGEDLRRFLTGEAIAAKTDSSVYLIRKFVRRHKVGVAFAACIVLGLITFGVVASVQASHNRTLATTLADQLVVANCDRGRLEVLSGAPYIGEKTLWSERLRRPDMEETYWALWEHYSRQPILRSTLNADNMYRGQMLLTPDHSMVLWTGTDGEIQAWDGELKRCLWRIEPDGTRCLDAAIAPDGSVAVFVGVKGKVVLVDPHNGSVIRRFSTLTEDLYSCALSPDAGTVYIGDVRGSAYECDMRTGAQGRTLARGLRMIRKLAISPDGLILAAATPTTTAMIDLTDGQMKGNLRLPSVMVRDLMFNRDGSRLYVLLDDRNLHIIDTEGMLETEAVAIGAGRSMALLDDRTMAICGTDGLAFWDLPSRTRSALYPGDEGGWGAIIPGPRPGTLLMSGMGTCLRLWETPIHSCTIRLLGGTDQIMFCAEPSPDGSLVAGTDGAGVVRVWNAATHALVGKCNGPSKRGRSVCWTPDGSGFYAIFESGAVARFRVSPKVELVESWKAHDGEACAAALDRSGTLLATGSQRDGIKLWDTRTRELVRPMQVTQSSVMGLEFTPDGTRLISAGIGPGVAISEVATGKRVVSRPDPYQNYRARLSPDGKTIVVARNLGDVPLLDAATLEPVKILRGHPKAVIDAHFSPDGRLLVTGSFDGSVRLWSLATGRTVAALDVGSEVSWATFVPGSETRWLSVSGGLGQARLIDLRYYDKHIANNCAYFLRRLRTDLPAPARVDELLAWARKATGDPAFTFDDPTTPVPMQPNGGVKQPAQPVLRSAGSE